jgi:ribonuclease-3
MARAKDKLAALQRTLGHTFADLALLNLALTHASARDGKHKGDNERLEFLGDRVLGLAVAEMLCEAHPVADEGYLARQFNRLVQKSTCAEVAAAIKLGDYIILSGSEVNSGGRAKAGILADACEAILGAIFLDAGFEATRKVIRQHWSDLLIEAGDAAPDAKTALQEWAQGKKLGLPSYVEVGRDGPDHAPQFTAEVRIDGVTPARGSGPNKRMAEQEAARSLLVHERVWTPDHD